MIVGAAVLPTAPLLVPGVSMTMPDGVDRVADAIDATLDGLPPHDLLVLVAPAGEQPHGLYAAEHLDLAGIGRPDVTRPVEVHRQGTEAVSRVTQYTLHRGEPLPLGLAVLALLAGERCPVVALAVPERADFDALVAVGTGVAEALGDPEPRAVLFAAGDLSAGLTERSPRPLIQGAAEWDQQVVAVVDSGRLSGLARLGPAEAQRVHALGWGPLAVLHGAVARAKIGMVVRHYSAPRGVGYLVASGA